MIFKTKKITIVAILTVFALLVFGNGVSFSQAIPESERNALIALYNSTDGDNWRGNGAINFGWLGDAGTECEWFGVECENGHITSLDLELMHLKGTIPSELENLTYLKDLDFGGNELTGMIPPEIGNLINLKSLRLIGNQLTGKIPVELANLKNLKTLWLPDNQLTGSIPPELGNLVELIYLSIGSNNISGSIPPELGNLINIEKLVLSGNQLTGSIPYELGNLINSRSLWLENNQLTGNIPKNFGNLTNIIRLSLQNNNLTGSIPKEIGSLKNIETLYLNNNQLSGPIPTELQNLTSLESLDIRYNSLSSDDIALRSFLDSVQIDGGDWESYQTQERILNITPVHGTADSNFIIWGVGYTPNTQIIIRVYTYPDKVQIGSVPLLSDSEGEFSRPYEPTSLEVGEYLIQAEEGIGGPQSNETTYKIFDGPVPNIGMAPLEGPQGTEFRLFGDGFTPGGTATLTLQGSDGSDINTWDIAIDQNGGIEYALKVSDDALVGEYIWWAVNNATGFRAVEMKFSVHEKGSSLTPATPVSPGNHAEIESTSVTFEWSHKNYNDEYELIIKDDKGDIVLTSGRITEKKYTANFSGLLSIGGTYKWIVVVHALGLSQESAESFFTYNPSSNDNDKDFSKFRVWIDKNANEKYDDQEGVEGAPVWVAEESEPRKNTGENGLVELSGIEELTKIYTYKQFYSFEHPRSNNEFGGQAFNPFFASNDIDSINGIAYNFVMASDVLRTDGIYSGMYFDFPIDKGGMSCAERDDDGNILIELVHPKIEWNLVVCFEEEPSEEYYNKIKTGIEKASRYVCDYTDGYSYIRNVVLINGAYENEKLWINTPQWDNCDVQIHNLEWPKAHPLGIFVNRDNHENHISFGIKWDLRQGWYDVAPNSVYFEPTSQTWISYLGHEMGHYLFGFLDEYLNANDEDKDDNWTYRQNNDNDPLSEPNIFPINLGVMDDNKLSNELSTPRDYFDFPDPNNKDQVPAQFLNSAPFGVIDSSRFTESQFHHMSCWEFFSSFFQNQIMVNMFGKNGFNNLDFFNNLIKPPHTSGYYPGDEKFEAGEVFRRDISFFKHNTVNIIDWNYPANSTQKSIRTASTDKTFSVADTEDISSDTQSKLYKSQNVSSGICVNLSINEELPGNLAVSITGTELNASPVVNLRQLPDIFRTINMTFSNNAHIGTVPYDYRNGDIIIEASTSSGDISVVCPFRILDPSSIPSPGFHSPLGNIEIRPRSSDFAQGKDFVLLDNPGPIPPNGDLVQIGDAVSVRFQSESVFSLDYTLSFPFSLDYIKGLDITKVQLCGWNQTANAWDNLTGGIVSQSAYEIIISNMNYTYYALFAPPSNDNIPPDAPANLLAETGERRWRVGLSWTVPYDNVGVYAYDIRFNTVAISDSNWDECIPVATSLKPDSAGARQSIILEMPDPDTDYWFGLQAYDAAGNASTLTFLTAPQKSHSYQPVNMDNSSTGNEITVDEGNTVTLNASSSAYSDKGIISYQWYQISKSPDGIEDVLISNTTGENITFIAPMVGENNGSVVFRLEMQDATGNKYSEDYTVHILNHGPGDEGASCFIDSIYNP